MESSTYVCDEAGKVWLVSRRSKELICSCENVVIAEQVVASLNFCAAFDPKALAANRLKIVPA